MLSQKEINKGDKRKRADEGARLARGGADAVRERLEARGEDFYSSLSDRRKEWGKEQTEKANRGQNKFTFSTSTSKQKNCRNVKLTKNATCG